MKNYFKNPIGIIGWFLVLVEAIAALVVIQSSLNDTLNTILVLFIVLFPCLVLWIFYCLVTKHHEKLYSPSDYKNEDNFVKSYNNSTQNMELLERKKFETLPTPIRTREGMSEEDINFIKETLNSIVAMQKTFSSQADGVSLVEETQKSIDEKWNTYITNITKKRKYNIDIIPTRDYPLLLALLREQGYDANIYEDPSFSMRGYRFEEHEAIWLGCKVPLKMALEVIKTAKKVFPHLKYIKLSKSGYAPEFVEYQIFIGGATNTAVEDRLRKWNQQDFEKLYTLKNKEELHSYIEQFSGK